MKLNKKMLMVGSVVVTLFITSCKKYLDAKPDKSLQIPTTINDLQALLDHGNLMNGQYGVSFDESSADNFYLPVNIYNQRDQENKNTYIWKNISYRNYTNDWAYLYNVVNVANIVLDNIIKISPEPNTQSSWNNVKGSALFYRAYSFLQGAFIFCNAYDQNTAMQDYGMALRLTSDFNIPSTRSSLADTYQRIIADLKDAIPLLPNLPQHVLRPSKSSTYALLARTYLSMRVYDSCMKYSSLALNLKSDLLNYNSLAINNSIPFDRFNAEVYFHNMIIQPNYVNSSRFYAIVDSSLYNSYSANDLRKIAFFRPTSPGFSFKGSYARSQAFIGLATDEVYLMRAECNARLGDKDAALSDLNKLMKARWQTGLFVPFTAPTSQIALSIILTERRKELIFRNLRWMDIKRLNKEGANISLIRIINGQTYTLPPNDKRFALALPSDITDMTGMPQNPY